jgi:hypothetical protein
MNLRDPGQAGLLALGALMVVVTPLCVSMAAIHAGRPLVALAVPAAVLLAGAGVGRIARRASPPAQGTDE